MNSIASIFAAINIWYWFALAAILVIMEVVIGTSFFLLWIGASAAIVGTVLFLYPALSWEYQFLLFAVVSAACLLFWHTYLKRRQKYSDQPTLNRRNEQYVGRTVTLTEPLVNGRGRIRIDDSFWRIEGPDMPEGTLVKVVGVDGVVLKVVSINSQDQ
jgi:membrane protein implicated in regulation of membrane protease activity